MYYFRWYFFNFDQGYIYTIGDNTYGELGVENYKYSEEFIRIAFFDSMRKDIVKAIAGGRNSIVLLNTGDIYVFGDNSEGQCTGLISRYTIPTKITFEFEFDRPIDIETGYNHCVMKTESGKLYSWGDTLDDKLGTHDHNQHCPIAKQVSKIVGKKIFSIHLGKNITILLTN